MNGRIRLDYMDMISENIQNMFNKKFDKEITQIQNALKTKIVDDFECNIKIYKGQGGFISFYGEDGDYHYFLKYETPLLKEGIYLLAVGSLLVGAYYLAYTRFYLNKKRYQRMFNLS